MERSRTLLLNGSYEPLSTIGWQRAISLVLSQKVDLVESYEHCVCSTSMSWRVPAVIRLKRYLRLGWLPVPFSRQNVFFRDGHRCQYCLEVFRSGALTLDHVIPRAQGGPRSWDNVVASCVPCNRRKRDRTPKEAGLSLPRPPKAPRWAQLILGELIPEDRPEEWEPWLRVA